MLGLQAHSGDFGREVQVEIDYLTKLHGDAALTIARAKIARPTIRSSRRRILEEVVRRLEGGPPRKKILGLFG